MRHFRIAWFVAATGAFFLGTPDHLNFHKAIADSPNNPSTRADHYGDPLPLGAISRIGTLRLAHGGGQANALTFSPDGKILAASWSGDGIRLWDTRTAKELRTLTIDKETSITSLSFSPDGKLLAAGGYLNSDILLWRVPSGVVAKRWHTDSTGTDSVAFSPDGRLLVTGLQDHSIRLWDVKEGRETRRFVGHESDVHSLSFLPDGKTLVSAAGDATVRFWEVSTGQQLSIIAGMKEAGAFNRVACSPNGKILASVDNGYEILRLWDVASRRELACVKKLSSQSSFWSIAFAPDSKVLVASGLDQKLRFFDAVTGNELREWSNRAFFGLVAFAPDGKSVATGALGRVWFWDSATGKEALPLRGPQDTIYAVAFRSGGHTLVTAGENGAVGIWDPVTGVEQERLRQSPAEFGPSRFEFYPPTLSSNGRRLAAIDRKHDIYIWATSTGQAPLKLAKSAADSRVVVSYDGETLAAHHPEDVIGLWNAETGSSIRQFGGEFGKGTPLAFSKDGRRLACIDLRLSDPFLMIWDIQTGKELLRFRVNPGMNYSAVFSSDGNMIVTWHTPMYEAYGTHDEFLLSAWDTTTGKELRRFHTGQIPVGPAWAVVISADGRTIISSHFGQSIAWELCSGRERLRFSGHRGYVCALALSPDGKRLASGSSDRTALVWNMENARFPHSSLEEIWAKLEGDDAIEAYQAISRMVAMAAESVPFLNRKVQPEAALTLAIARFIADLDSDQFSVREHAATELEKMAELAAPAMRSVLRESSSPEVGRRAEELLAKLDDPTTPIKDSTKLAKLRAVEVLEAIGNADAQEVLKRLAAGESRARLTQDAKASLERLKIKRSG